MFRSRLELRVQNQMFNQGGPDSQPLGLVNFHNNLETKKELFVSQKSILASAFHKIMGILIFISQKEIIAQQRTFVS